MKQGNSDAIDSSTLRPRPEQVEEPFDRTSLVVHLAGFEKDYCLDRPIVAQFEDQRVKMAIFLDPSDRCFERSGEEPVKLILADNTTLGQA